MPVALRSVSVLNAGFGAGAQTVPAPSGATTGDLLVAACMEMKEGTAAPTWPGDWTLAGSVAGGTRSGANGASAVFYKAAAASESSYSVTYTATTNTLIWCLTGANLSAPFDVLPSFTTGTAATMTTPTITVTTGAAVLASFSVLWGSATVTFATPTNYVLNGTVRSGNYGSSGFASRVSGASGSTAVSTTSSPAANTTTTPWQTLAMSIAPAPTALIAESVVITSTAVNRASFY